MKYINPEMTKLTDRKIRFICNHVVNIGDWTVESCSNQYNVTIQRIQQLVKEYRETSEYPKLNTNQFSEIEEALRLSPSEFDLKSNLWDGKILSEFIMQQYGVSLGVRQCQRLFRQFGFRYRKPRSFIGKGDPEKKNEYKKTSIDGS